MNITPVNSANSQPNFNGYLGKSVTDFINGTANRLIKKELKQANRQGRQINTQILSEIRNRADKCIDTLQQAVEPLHPDTFLSVNYPNRNGDAFIRLKLKNCKLKKEVLIESYPDNYYTMQKKQRLRKPVFTLKAHETFIERAKEKLSNNKMKEFENYLFRIFTEDISETLFPMLKAKKADKLAPEFGFSANYTETLKKEKELIKAEKRAKKQKVCEEKKALKLSKRNVKDKNIETAKKYLK